MNKLAVIFLFVCLTALPMAAQTKVLVAKSRVSTSVVAGGHLLFRPIAMSKGAYT